jgi:hypothetical protein
MAVERKLRKLDPVDEAPQNLERFRKHLAIDKDELDACLIEQPEIFDHVADAHSLAIADRDATKLDLDEAEAEEGSKIRDRAAQMEEKLTEASVREQLILSSRLRILRRQHLEKKAIVDRWAALKESFHQRNYMLRELAPMQTARMFSSGNAVRVGSREAVSDSIKGRIDEERGRRGFKSDR